MTNLLRSVLRRGAERAGGANETTTISILDWAKMFNPGGQVNYKGQSYQAFTSAAASAGYSSVVFSVERWRVSVFSEARFAWQRMRAGRPMPGALFGTTALGVLEVPWRGASTRDLLAVCEMDVAAHGNSYWVLDELGYLVRLEPTTVKIITEAVYDQVTGFRIGERLSGYAVIVDREVSIYAPEDIAHYKPYPANNSQWVGQAWISACLDDVAADAALTEHKRAAVANGASLTYVVSLDPTLTPTQFDNFIAKFKEDHQGPMRAGEVTFLQGGSDIKAVGQSFSDLAMSETQGAGETRIAAAGGVHPVIVGLAEGLKGAATNAGAYQSAKENFLDGTMAPLWGAFVGAFAGLLKAPGPDVRLWYDSRDIPFMRKDITALAEVMVQNASVISVLTTAGYDPDAIIAAVMANDVSGLVGAHSGLFSVQLRPAGIEQGAGAGGTGAASAGPSDAVVAAIQKVYLGVGVLLTSDEARAIVNEAGADLAIPGPDFKPPPAPVAPAAANGKAPPKPPAPAVPAASA